MAHPAPWGLAMISAVILAFGLHAAPAAALEPAASAPSSFTCGDRKLLLRFGAEHARPVVVVDAGDGPHTLSAQPWDAEQRALVWSDGARTLTWGTGVHLMYMADGGTHMMCGRAGGHHH